MSLPGADEILRLVAELERVAKEKLDQKYTEGQLRHYGAGGDAALALRHLRRAIDDLGDS